MAAKRLPDQARTTVQVSRRTKVALDALREQCRTHTGRLLSYDDVLYDILSSELSAKGVETPLAEWRRRDLREIQRRALRVMDGYMSRTNKRETDQITFNDLMALDREVEKSLQSNVLDAGPGATDQNSRKGSSRRREPRHMARQPSRRGKK
jgi:hypothetical protein